MSGQVQLIANMERFMYTKGGESLFITPSHIRHDCHTLIMHYYTTLYYFEKSFTQCKMEFRKLLLSSTLLSAKALISIAKQLIWGVQGEGPEKGPSSIVRETRQTTSIWKTYYIFPYVNLPPNLMANGESSGEF